MAVSYIIYRKPNPIIPMAKLEENEIVKQGDIILKEIFSRNPEFDVIESKISELRDEVGYENIHDLTDDILVISSYLSRISSLTARYLAQVNGAYLERKDKYFGGLRERIDKGDNITKAKEWADESSLDKKREEAIWQYVYETLKGREKAYYAHITVCPSRVGVLKNEMINSRNNT